MPHLRGIPGSWWEKIQQKSIRGTPDILGCVQGKFVALELKKDSKANIDELQKYKLEQISKAGGLSAIVYPENWEKVYSILTHIAKGK